MGPSDVIVSICDLEIDVRAPSIVTDDDLAYDFNDNVYLSKTLGPLLDLGYSKTVIFQTNARGCAHQRYKFGIVVSFKNLP
jgi:hypothetical protein